MGRYEDELKTEQIGRLKEKMDKGLEHAKEAELYISHVLSSMGYTIENALDPFKIIARSIRYSFVADIKYKRLYRFIPVLITRVELYNTTDVGSLNKILILKSRSKSDYPDWHSRNYPDRFIYTIDIPKICYTVGPYYAIESAYTNTLAALRKKLEG